MKSLLTLFTHHRVSVFALLLLMLGFSATASAQWASDGNFNVADWTCTVLPPPVSGSTLASASCSQFTADGNPPFSRKTFHHYASPQSVFVAHVYQPASAIYDPVNQGAIVGLRYNYDLKSDGPNNAAYHFLVFQDSTFYRCSDPLWPSDNSMMGNNNWLTHPQNPITYSAANCVKLYGPSPKVNPDFSCKGKPIQFGFESGISSGYNDRVSYLDNWKVVIIKGEPCQPTCGAINKPAIHCNKSGTGFTYTFEVANNSTNPTQYILLSPPPGATYTVSPSVINSPLNPGQSTTVSVNIANAPPTGNVCIDVLLADKRGRPCCKLQTCLPLPECPCLKVIKETVECGTGGSYTYAVQLQNLTGTLIQQVFVIPKFPTNVTVGPSLVQVTLGPNGGQATFSITIHNAAPGSTVFLTLAPSGEKPLCCSLEVRFTVPGRGQC